MSTGNDIERRQKFLDDLVAAVRDGSAKENAADPESSEKSSAELARYALLRVQLARSEARLKSGELKPKKPASKSYFNLRSLLGLDAISGWYLLAFFTICLLVHGHRNDYFSVTDFVSDTLNQRCLLSAEDFIMEMSRAPVNCGMCKDMREMPVEYNMTRELFLKKYAYTARPVLIKNVVKDWRALQNFSLDFFKNLYDSKPDSYKVQDDAGQFFAYKTEFGTLREALHMSEERRQKDWYFGWSNADEEIGQKLRQYYSRPDFLPEDAESSRIDWMFMGISRKGAQLHIDYVSRPSWQAQIKGRKIWEVVPSPECASVCHSFNITVHAGDIINIDTNRWYHATYVYPGDFSVTIGSEYD
uniref:Cupin_8 domain-containing protein n=1 Tax=Macrostomum lignano TaxID=282301 RepID=A0A1I8GHS9_9PLAT